MTPYSDRACSVRVSVSRGSSMRSGSGIGTWKTRIWPSVSGVSGTRCRVWMMVASLVCVVEQPGDVLAFERTGQYKGRYHVLGGALSPLDGVEPADLRVDELLRRIDRGGVEEVVLATNPNMTGEATAAFLADRLRGHPALPDGLEDRLHVLEQRSPATGETDLIHQRVLELEERLDFAERLLARPGEADRLPAGPPGSPERMREITPTGGTR